MNNQPVLFYSLREPNSKQILDTLKALNKESLCRMFPIDGKQRSELPPFLKSVPTLYVPDTKDVYVGKDIYSYISKPVGARREIPTETPAQKATAAPSAGPSEYEAWGFEGSKGYSESYANWNSPNSFTSDNQLNFSFLGGASYTPPNATPEPQTKQSFDGQKQGRNDDLASRLEEYKKVRETEFKGVSRQ